jgi:predicted component of type VI protein secretion system
MATAAVLGVPLKEERPPPPELPARGDLFYFRIDVSHKRWLQIAAEKEAILDWGKTADSVGVATVSDAKFSLYMTLP